MYRELDVSSNGTLEVELTESLANATGAAQRLVDDAELALPTGCTAQVAFELDVDSIPVDAIPAEQRKAVSGVTAAEVMRLYPPPPPSPDLPPFSPPAAPPLPPQTPLEGVVNLLSGVSSALASGILGVAITGNATSGPDDGNDNGALVSEVNATRNQVNEVLSLGASALDEAADSLAVLTTGEGSAGIQPQDAAPFVELIDALTQAATATILEDAVPPPPLLTSPPSIPPSPTGTSIPPPPPLTSQSEQEAAEDAAREEQRRRDAEVRNSLADSITKTLTVLSTSLLKATAEVDRPITLKAASFTGVFTRQSVAPDPAQPPPALPADSDAEPVALFVDPNISDPVAALGAGNTSGFVLPTSLPALRGIGSVETTVLYFPKSIRDGGAPASRGLRSTVVSPATSLSLRVNGSELKVPTGSGQEILIKTRVVLGNPNATSECTEDLGPACDNVTTATQAEIDALALECEVKAKRAVRPGKARAEVDACLAVLEELDANLTAQAAHCAALPMPCNGRGECNDGLCVCAPSWYGPQCEVQPACKFWDVASQNWSTTGCRMASLTLEGAYGHMVCACDHLTEFAVVANALVRPDEFFNALGRLSINIPIPLRSGLLTCDAPTPEERSQPWRPVCPCRPLCVCKLTLPCAHAQLLRLCKVARASHCRRGRPSLCQHSPPHVWAQRSAGARRQGRVHHTASTLAHVDL